MKGEVNHSPSSAQSALSDERINELALLNLGYDRAIRTLDFARAIEREARAAASAQATKEPVGDTGHPEADRIINRLLSSDPEFDDCCDAATLIRELVVEHKGPDGFATWKEAAIAERLRRVMDENHLRDLFLEALDFGIGFGPRLSQVGEWKETRLDKAKNLLSKANITPPPSPDAREAGGGALTDAFKSPLTSYGMLVRALRIVAGTTLGDMAKHLQCSSSMLSGVELGRKPLTDAMVADTAAFFSRCGIADTLHALAAACAKDQTK